MTSRERVLAALNFSEPDKIPIDFGGHRSSGISAIAYSKLKKAMGITSGEIYVYDMIQQLAIIEEPVLQAFEVDTIELGRAFCLNADDWKDWVLPDGTPCKIPNFIRIEKDNDDWYLLAKDGKRLGVQKKGCHYFEQIYFPLENRDYENDDFSDFTDLFGYNMWCATASPGNFNLEGDELNQFIEGAKRLRASTNRAIIGLFGGNLFETPQMMFKMDNYLLYTELYPEATLRLSAKLCDYYCENIKKWLGAVGPYIDIMLFGDDLGSNHGPLIDPLAYRKFYKPYHKKMWSLVKELAPHIKIQLHTCGSIEGFLEDFIDAGLDAVNPVQISCRGMNLEELKAKYHGRISFWGGGCETQHILPSATPNEVEAHVKEQLNIMKGNGGFIFQQVHNILGTVPIANVIRMFETVKKYR